MATGNSTVKQDFDEATDKLMLAMDLATVTTGYLAHTEELQASDVVRDILRKLREAYDVIIDLEFKDRISADGAMEMIGKSRPESNELYGPAERARVLLQENHDIITNLRIGEAPSERQLNDMVVKGQAIMESVKKILELVDRLEDWEIARRNYERKS